MALEADEEGPGPRALLAVTVKVELIPMLPRSLTGTGRQPPLFTPLNVAEVVPGATVWVELPEPCMVTVYPVSAPPPPKVPGGVQFTAICWKNALAETLDVDPVGALTQLQRSRSRQLQRSGQVVDIELAAAGDGIDVKAQGGLLDGRAGRNPGEIELHEGGGVRSDGIDDASAIVGVGGGAVYKGVGSRRRLLRQQRQ